MAYFWHRRFYLAIVARRHELASFVVEQRRRKRRTEAQLVEAMLLLLLLDDCQGFKLVALDGDPFERVNHEHPTNGYDCAQKEAEK